MPEHFGHGCRADWLKTVFIMTAVMSFVISLVIFNIEAFCLYWAGRRIIVKPKL